MVQARLAEFQAEFHPEGTRQREEVEAIARASVRLERCQLEEEDWRRERCDEAEFDWEAARTAEAMDLAHKLPGNPQRIQPKLIKLLRGARWMRAEWLDLAGRVRVNPAGSVLRPLDEASRQRAFDLLGLNADRRQGTTPLDPPGGPASEDVVAAHQDALIATEMAALEPRVNDEMVARDEAKRLAIVDGASPGIDHQTRLIRRYETEARRVKNQAEERLKLLQEEAAARKKRERDREISMHCAKYFETPRPIPPGILQSLGANPYTRQPTPAPAPAAAPAPVATEAPAPASASAPVAPAAKVEATMAPAPTVSPQPLSVLEEVLAETAGMTDPNALPISITDSLSRRERKAAAKAAHRGVA